MRTNICVFVFFFLLIFGHPKWCYRDPIMNRSHLNIQILRSVFMFKFWNRVNWLHFVAHTVHWIDIHSNLYTSKMMKKHISCDVTSWYMIFRCVQIAQMPTLIHSIKSKINAFAINFRQLCGLPSLKTIVRIDLEPFGRGV